MSKYVYSCICVCRAFMGICMYVVRSCVCMCLVRSCMMYVCRVFIHVHVCCSFMCMRMRMCVLVYVCAGVCEHVAHSCVCRAFVGMPCVNVYIYTKKYTKQVIVNNMQTYHTLVTSPHCSNCLF